MNIIDKIKYFYFYKRFKSILDKNNIDYFETKNFAIENDREVIYIDYKNIEYQLYKNNFIITTEQGILNSYFVPFDIIFWDILKEFKEELKKVRIKMKERQLKIKKTIKEN